MPEVQDEVIGRLQEALLKAILSGQPLPGSAQPMVLPDSSFILSQPTVFLIDENLAESISLEELSLPIRIVSLEALRETARAQGNVAYLRFQPAEKENNTIRLTLEARIAPEDPGQHILGLSGVQVKFHEISGQWKVIEAPSYFAS
jgi:hypothetical protein